LHGAAPNYDLVQSVWTSAFPASYCGQGAGVTKLLLRWDSWSVSSGANPTGSNAPSSAAYVVEGTSLHRVYCAAGTTVTSDVTLVDNLSAASVTCASPTACGSSTPPATIQLTLTISSGPADEAAPDPITLTGRRRQT
jgi:hypothetical protein